MEEIEVAHLAGFFDAVGNIGVNIKKDDRYKLGYIMRPVIRLSRSNEDDPIFGKMMEYCEDEGVVNYNVSETENDIRWFTRDKNDIERFLEPLMPHLVSSYRRAELMIGVIIPSMKDKKHLEKDTFYEMVGVVEEMRNQKPNTPDMKYDQEHFAEEWSVVQ